MVYAKEGEQEIGKQFTGDAEVCMADVDLTPVAVGSGKGRKVLP